MTSRFNLLQYYTLRVSILDYRINEPKPFEVCEYLIFDSVNCPEQYKARALEDARNYRKELSLKTGNFVSLVDISEVKFTTWDLQLADINNESLKNTTRMNVQLRLPNLGGFLSYKQAERLGYLPLIEELKQLEAC